MKRGILLIFGVVVIIAVIVLIIFNPFKQTQNTYGCAEIKKQIDLCWKNKQPTSEDIINCWEAPLDIQNTCEDLEDTDYYKQYY